MALNNRRRCWRTWGGGRRPWPRPRKPSASTAQLAGARPDAFLPDLAMALNNLGLLADLGRREEALAAIQEAVTIRRGWPARPDAFLPDLAAALNNQSVRLAGPGSGKRRWPPSRKPSPSTAGWPEPAPQYLQAGMPVR